MEEEGASVRWRGVVAVVTQELVVVVVEGPWGKAKMAWTLEGKAARSLCIRRLPTWFLAEEAGAGMARTGLFPMGALAGVFLLFVLVR